MTAAEFKLTLRAELFNQQNNYFRVQAFSSAAHKRTWRICHNQQLLKKLVRRFSPVYPRIPTTRVYNNNPSYYEKGTSFGLSENTDEKEKEKKRKTIAKLLALLTNSIVKLFGLKTLAVTKLSALHAKAINFYWKFRNPKIMTALLDSWKQK